MANSVADLSRRNLARGRLSGVAGIVNKRVNRPISQEADSLARLTVFWDRPPRSLGRSTVTAPGGTASIISRTVCRALSHDSSASSGSAAQSPRVARPRNYPVQRGEPSVFRPRHRDRHSGHRIVSNRWVTLRPLTDNKTEAEHLGQ